MENKIFLCTTFRDFNGSFNDTLQINFLNSIKSQSYQNYMVVVTMFGETKVKDTVSKILGDKVVFFDVGKKEYKYSLSEVFLNGYYEARKIENSILMWCTSDIVLDKNYFETMKNNYSESYAGLTHPNYYRSKKEEIQPAYNMGDLLCGIDALFFSVTMLDRSGAIAEIEKYRFYGWGIFENFLACIGAENAQNRINTVNISNIYKTENDREVEGESNKAIVVERGKNYYTFMQYLKDKRYSYKYVFLLFCHNKYKVIKSNLQYRKMKYRINKEMIKHILYLCIPNIGYRIKNEE